MILLKAHSCASTSTATYDRQPVSNDASAAQLAHGTTTQAPKPVPCSLETYLVEIDTTSGKRLTEASLAKHESAGRVD